MIVVADRWDATLGGRERYANDLVAHLTAEGRQVRKVVRGRTVVHQGTPILALTPVRDATHYQLHGGLAAAAFAAERTSFESSLRRTFFHAALRLNRRRQRLLRDESCVLAGNAALMAFSRAVARDLIQLGVAPERITVSRPGVDLRCFHPPPSIDRDALSRRVRLVLVAHNFALKGLGNAIHALARATQSGIDVSLSVAGRGSAAAYQRLASTLRVSHRVSFCGPLSQTQTADLYRASDALIHPTFYDPFPRVAVEALASGCPVITTASCGAAEILAPGENGFVVAGPTDIDALAQAITALADCQTLNRMRHAAADSGRRFDRAGHFHDMTKWLFESPLEPA
jgi:glycosyltransferase involved in cell wall biosynthesis